MKINLEVLKALLERARDGELNPEEVELDDLEGWVRDDDYEYCLIEEDGE